MWQNGRESCGHRRKQERSCAQKTDIFVPLGYYLLAGQKKYYRIGLTEWFLFAYLPDIVPTVQHSFRDTDASKVTLNSGDKDFSRRLLVPNCSEARLSYQICTETRSYVGNHLPPPSQTSWMLQYNPKYPRGADKSLARPGRKRLTGNLQPRTNWPTWASSVLIIHPILRIRPRRTTNCSLDWKNDWKGSRLG
jgi:hypothetical protein